MRIVSYNILDGGEGRADPIAEVLLAQRADVIAIVEADNPDVLHRLSQRLNMDYVSAAGKRHSVALFSRWQIGDTVNLSGQVREAGDEHAYRFLLADVLVEPSGDVIPFGVLHLHPRATRRDDQIRMKQLQSVCATLQQYRLTNRPHVVMGDFNSDSPVQRLDPARCKKSTADAWESNGGMIPRDTIQMMLDQGYVDSLAVTRPDSARSAGSFTTQHPGQRVDYIFAYGFPQTAIKDAWIEVDRLAKFASDHFPVGCEIA